MRKLISKNKIKLIIVIVCLGLFFVIIGAYAVNHSSQAQQSSTANTGTNQTSQYVNESLNNGVARRYTTAITFDKIHNAVEYHLTPSMSQELKGHRAYPHQTRTSMDFDRTTLHSEIRSNISHIHRHCHDKTARAKLIYDNKAK